MAELRYDQSNFTEGQLDPRVAARTDYDGYANAAKTIRNCFVLPQGGVSKRWGTRFVDTVPLTSFEQTSYKYSEISTLIYDSNTVYLLLWTANSLNIYLENNLMATITTAYTAEDIDRLRFGQVDNRIIVVNENYIPRQLIRSPSAANALSAVDLANNYISVSTPMTVGRIVPIVFSTSGALPVTKPQIYPARPYFAKVISANQVRIFASSADAVVGTDYFVISAAGSGSSSLIPQNTWSLTDVAFTYMPAFDFDGGYNSITFTPGGISGTAHIVASAGIFTVGMVGGVFHGNGGVMRLTNFNSPTDMFGTILEDFTDTSAIQGSLAFLGEPAWSNLRGWPRCVSFFQNRLVFAGTPSIQNGVWLSVVNEAYNFDDSESLDDNAISWYPAGGSISVISSITSCRTLVLHTNTGTFTTPVSSEAAVTPKNFTLTEQNKFGASDIQPVFIDNQIIYVDQSGNNVRNMVWEISQSSFVVNNISVTASSLIDKPIDMAAFGDPDFADGSFVFFVNRDGTLTVFQTLYEQRVAAWSTADTATSTAQPASFFQRASTALGKCWFLIKRQVLNGGVLSYVTYIEQLDFTVYTDCTVKQSNINSATITGLSVLNGSTVQVLGDGYVMMPPLVTAGTAQVPESIVNATVGHQISSTLSLLPVNNVLQDGTNFYKAKHIRSFYVQYFQTIGSQIQGFDIPNQNLQDVVLNQVPKPSNGIYNYTLMEGWDAFAFDISIIQNLPLPMTILGISYVMET